MDKRICAAVEATEAVGDDMEQMQSDEQFVRGVWEDVRICSQPDLNGRNMAYWWVIANGKGPLSKTVEKSQAETWSAAAAFTRERLEEVRQLREEIEFIRGTVDALAGTQTGKAYARTLSRLEAELARLTSDMKAGAF